MPGHGNVRWVEDALALSLDAAVPLWPWAPMSRGRCTGAQRLLPGPYALPRAPAREAQWADGLPASFLQPKGWKCHPPATTPGIPGLAFLAHLVFWGLIP